MKFSVAGQWRGTGQWRQRDGWRHQRSVSSWRHVEEIEAATLQNDVQQLSAGRARASVSAQPLSRCLHTVTSYSTHYSFSFSPIHSPIVRDISLAFFASTFRRWRSKVTI